MAADRFTAAIAAEWKDQSYYADAERRDWLEPFWTHPRFRAKFDQLDIRRYVSSPAATAATSIIS